MLITVTQRPRSVFRCHCCGSSRKVQHAILLSTNCRLYPEHWCMFCTRKYDNFNDYQLYCVILTVLINYQFMLREKSTKQQTSQPAICCCFRCFRCLLSFVVRRSSCLSACSIVRSSTRVVLPPCCVGNGRKSKESFVCVCTHWTNFVHGWMHACLCMLVVHPHALITSLAERIILCTSRP